MPRLGVAVAFVAVWFCVLGARLYGLQVRDGETFRSRADQQQQAVVEVKAPRGTIFDAAGRELAVSVAAESAYMRPAEVEDPAELLRALDAVLGLDRAEEEELRRRLAGESPFVWIRRQLDPPDAERVRELELPGVGFVTESKRYYPMGSLMAPVLGFVGTDGDGLAGLEAQWEKEVAGRATERIVLRDARRGRVSRPGLSFTDAAPGADLHLTIDAYLQHRLEKELADALERHQARAAMGVLVDPRTGAVRAMASLPSFDPHRFADVDPQRWNNGVVMSAYEPGSTFKVVTAAAALEDNLIDPTDVIECENGSITLGATRIRDHKPFDRLTFREVIAKSSNVGTVKVGLLAGPERLARQIEAFGFGEPTGIDLPGESAGIVRPPERWKRLTNAYVSFGQGISATPLQMAMAFAAVAAGGERVTPFVVESVERDGERRVPRRDEPLGRALSAATARTVERLLEAVVTEGTGKAAAIPGYRVAGKTGTAQKAEPGRGYLPDRYVASFAGFAPARAPVLAGIIVVDEPRRNGYHGGEVAAGVFSAVVGPALLYLGVPPETGLLPRPDRVAAETPQVAAWTAPNRATGGR